jgi:hypothetical protein
MTIEINRCWREVGSPSQSIRAILITRTGDTVEFFDSTDEEIDEMVEDMRDTAEARARWVAAGSPWTADDQAFADRMSGY